MKTVLVDAQSNLTIAQQWMKRAVDKKRQNEEYKIDNEVVLSTTNLQTYSPNLPLKLRHGGLAPFASKSLCHQLHLDWSYPWDGRSIPSSM